MTNEELILSSYSELSINIDDIQKFNLSKVEISCEGDNAYKTVWRKKYRVRFLSADNEVYENYQYDIPFEYQLCANQIPTSFPPHSEGVIGWTPSPSSLVVYGNTDIKLFTLSASGCCLGTHDEPETYILINDVNDGLQYICLSSKYINVTLHENLSNDIKVTLHSNCEECGEKDIKVTLHSDYKSKNVTFLIEKSK